MARYVLLVVSWLGLVACSTAPSSRTVPQVSKQDQLACEQQALVAKSSYVARIKTPEHEIVNISQSWAGGVRSDSGEWVFNAAFKTCMQHASKDQP